MSRSVVRQELRNAVDGVLQFRFMRQEHHAEVIGLGPVKARTLHENDVGGFQKFLEELTVVFNGIHLGIQPREQDRKSVV